MKAPLAGPKPYRPSEVSRCRLQESASAGGCPARRGEEYVVYLMAGGRTRISGLPRQYNAFWFNPREGQTRTAQGGPEFGAPDDND